MSVSTFMQFGLESDIDAKDVGQPKFRLVERFPHGETLCVLLGSLHMPLEDEATVEAVEAYVNTQTLRDTLILALSRHFNRPIATGSIFEYVPSEAAAYLLPPGIERTARR